MDTNRNTSNKKYSVVGYLYIPITNRLTLTNS